MTTATSNTVTFTVSATTAPAWFVSATEGQWTEIARNANGRAIESVREIPAGHPAIYNDQGHYGESPYGSGLVNHFGGAVANQARSEVLIVACGGHNSYHGNEGYALGLREEMPKWYRVCNATPAGAQTLYNPSPNGANSDGRMSAVHGWGRPCFGMNRVIWMAVDSAGGADYAGSYMWSWNREHAGMPTSSTAGSPLAHDGGAGPFTLHGVAPGAGSNDAIGPAVFDRNTNIAWSFSGRDVPTRVWWRNFSSGATGNYSPATSGVYAATTWAVHLHDLGVTLLGNMYADVNGGGNRLAVYDPATPTQYYIPPLTNGTNWGSGGFQKAGAVYDAATRKVYIADPPNYGANTIWVLDVPSNPRTGTFVRRTYSAPGTSLRWFGTTGTHGNFQLIEDMGTISAVTRKALVFVSAAHNDATFALKLPVAGL